MVSRGQFHPSQREHRTGCQLKVTLVAALFACSWVFAIGTPEIGAAEPRSVNSLTPDEVISLNSFWQQLRDIDNRPWNSFKQSAVKDLSGHIAVYINNAPGNDVAAAILTLRQQGFRTCLQGMYADRLGDLQRSLEELKSAAIQSDKASAEQKATKVTQNADGTVNVPIPESLAEILWLLGPLEPWLSASAVTWPAKIDRLPKAERQVWISQKIIECVHDYTYLQRRVAKLQLLLEQPSWVRELIARTTPEGIDLNNIRELLTRYEGSSGELASVIKSLTTTTSDKELVQIQKKILEIRRRIDSVRVTLASDFVKPSASLKEFFDTQAPILRQLQRYYESLYSRRHIDFPTNRKPDDSAPFLRFHVTPPQNQDCRGLLSCVHVSVSVCRWIGGKTTVTMEGDSGATVKFDQRFGATGQAEKTEKLRPIEDIPLGLSISQVLFREDGSLQISNGITPKVTVNQSEMRQALRKMGLPEQVTVDDISVQIIDLTQFVVRASVIPPEFAISGATDIATNKVPVVINITLENLGKGVIEGVLGTTVDSLQNHIETSIRKNLGLPNKPEILQITTVESLGQWRNGTIAYSVGLKLGKVGDWSVPDDVGTWTVRAWCRKAGDRWRIGLSPSGAPAGLVRFLHERLVQYVKTSSLDATKLGQTVSEIAKYVRFENPRYDSEAQTISAVLTCGSELLPADSTIKIPPTEFTINLRTGKLDLGVFSSFNKQLEAASQIMLAEFLKRVNGELSEKAAKLLKGQKLEFFGANLAVVGDPVHDKGRIRFNVKGMALGKSIEATNVLLVGGKITESGVETPRFDFRETVLKPDIGKLIADLLDLDESILRIGPTVKLPDAISFSVSIHIEQLGGDILLGDISLGTQGVRANPLETLKAKLPDVVEKFVIDKLAGRTVIEDLGPISQLTLDKTKTRFLRQLEVWVKGKAEVPGLRDTYIPFSARIIPGPPDIRIDEGEATTEAIMAGLKQVLPENFLAGSPVKNPQPIRAKPYGVSFDLEIKAWVFTVAAKGIRLTTRGMELPQSIAVQPPGMIPVPTGFAIVDPGVVVPLKRDGEIGIVGDVTLASKGIDKIVKLRCVLTTSMRHPATFKLDGTLILVDMLPLLKVDGTASFETGILDLNAQTVGIVDKIIQVRDRTHVEAVKGLFEQNGSMGVLGIQLSQTNIKIEAFRPALTAKAKVSIPIVTADIGVTASPRLSDFKAHAEFDVGLGAFSLSSGILDVDSSKVDFRFHVAVFDVRVIAPSITTLTPDRVINAILSLFDFDIRAFFNAVINRKITISFFDEGGKRSNGSIGRGDSLPPDSRGKPSDSLPSPSQPSTPGPGTDTPAEQTPGSGFALPPGDPTQPGARPEHTSPDSNTKGHEPVENLVRTRLKGDTTYEIVKDPEGSGLFVEKFTWQGRPYYGWMLLSKEVRDHLLSERQEDGGKVMVLSWLWRHLTDAERGKIKARNQQPVDWISAYLTLNARNQIHVSGRFSDGKVSLVELPFDQIGPKIGTRKPDDTYDLFRNFESKSAESKFTDGDIAVLSHFARARFVPNFGAAKFFRRLSSLNAGLKLGESDVVRPDGYLYELTDERARTQLIFQPREGNPLVLDRTDSVYDHLKLSDADSVEKSKRTANVIALLAHTSAIGIPCGYLFGASSGPMIFVVGESNDSKKHAIWTVKESGEFAKPLSLVDAGLTQDTRSSMYFDELDGTSSFGKSLSDETISEQWTELQIRQYDLGVNRQQFLALLSGLKRELSDAERIAKQSEKWLAEATSKSEPANVKLYSTELKQHTSAVNDLRLRLSSTELQRNLRVAFSRGVGPADGPAQKWGFALCFRKPTGQVVRYPSTGVFEGSDVELAFDTWIKSNLIIDPPHKSLATAAARRWLVEQMLGPERTWTTRWKADPVTLLRNIKRK